MSVNLSPTIAANIEQFTGRTWLLPKVLDWYEGSQARILLITGGPGTGKSMIMAWLAGHGPLPDDATAREQLEQIRAQARATHFCIAASGTTAPKALAQNLADQLTRNVPSFADALAASLADLVTITPIQKVERMERGTSLTGVQIGTLNLAGLSEELSFNRTLREPLKKLYQNGYRESLLLLVDALDEALTYTGTIDIVQLLAKLDDLPVQVRFLASTRPDPRVLKHFRQAVRVDLIDDAPAEEDDVRAYVGGRLGALEDAQRTAAAERISRAATGNFLYAHLVLADLLPRLPSIPDIDALPLPEGLGGLYAGFVNRELGADEDRWYDEFEPVLGLIAVAQGEGLRRVQIERITGQDARRTLRVCKQYLDGPLPDGPFRCFHRSFVDWLLEDEENVDYHIDGARMHQQIANYYWQAHHPEWTDCDTYGLRYLPIHQIGAGQQAELHALLLDFGWLQAKLETTDVTALIADYDLLPGDADALLVGDALHLSAHVLAEDKIQLAGQLLGRLMDLEAPEIQMLLEGALAWRGAPWLRPLRPCLTAPGGPLRRTLRGHTGWVNAVTVYDGGRRAISASGDETLKIWDLERGQEILVLEGHTNYVTAVEVFAAGRRAISASEDTTLKVWDLKQGQVLCTLEGHSNAVTSVAVYCDGRRAISASADQTLRIWDLENAQLVRILEGHGDEVKAVAVCGDGRCAISASADQTLRSWDLESGQVLRTMQGHRFSVDAVAVYADGQKVISASADTTLKVWDLETGQVLHTFQGHAGPVNAVAVYDDGLRAISASYDGTLKVWNLENGQELRTMKGHIGSVRAVAVYSCGQRAISTSRDKTLKVWDLVSGQELRSPEGRTGWVYEVVVYDSGRRAISASHANTLELWDLENIQELRILEGPTHQSRCVTAVAVFNEGRQAISAWHDNSLSVWDLENGQVRCTLEGHTGAVKGIAVYLDGRKAISASLDKTLKIWDLESGQLLRTLEGHADYVHGVAVYASGRRAISASADNTLRVWDLESGRVLHTLDGHTRGVNAVAVYDGGRRALSASADLTLKVWELRSGAEVRTLRGHTSEVNAVTVFADGRRALSASWDGTLRVWDLELGIPLTMFSGDSAFTACVIAPDGCTVGAGDYEDRVHFLRLENA